MGLFNAIMSLSGAIDTDVIEDERMARHTSYRIGGRAALFITCHSYHALRRCVDVLTRERVPWVIVGKGSNLLVSDSGYSGAVIALGREFSRTVLAEDGVTLTVGAGVILARLVNEALDEGALGPGVCRGHPRYRGRRDIHERGLRDAWVGTLIEDMVTYKPGRVSAITRTTTSRGGIAPMRMPGRRDHPRGDLPSCSRREVRHPRDDGAPSGTVAVGPSRFRELRFGLSQPAR